MSCCAIPRLPVRLNSFLLTPMKAPLECPSLNGMPGSLRPARARQLVVPLISRWLLREAGTRMETTSAAP